MYQLNQETFKLNSPYSLKNGNENSDKFYSDLDSFTSRVVSKGLSDLDTVVSGYKSVMKISAPDKEILLDMMILGVFWKEYAGLRIPFLGVKSRLLKILYMLRKHKKLKKQVDDLRGKLAGKWIANRERRIPEIRLSNLKRLELFLLSTCEFNEEIKRISAISLYLSEKSAAEAITELQKIINFGEWFSRNASYYLGSYTAGVSRFLKTHPVTYKGKEDFFFCGRKESEYYLNMVGAQMMNRTLANEFSKTEEKILLLPTCMSEKGSDCKARIINGDLSCIHCSRNCNISKASVAMKVKGIRTVLIRHSSSFSKWLEPWSNQRKTGLIGVACVLNLLTGGFEMKRLGIPSQCAFLDHSGCSKHWNGKCPSELNIHQVCRLNKEPELIKALI